MVKKKTMSRAQNSAYGGASTVGKSQPHNTVKKQDKGGNFYHKDEKLKRLKMYKSGRPTRDKHGTVIKAGAFLSRDAPVARVQPDRRWFGNTRVVGQRELEQFREEIAATKSDPYQVLLRQSKLPMSLLVDSTKVNKMNLLDAEGFDTVFGPKAHRKRPKLLSATMEELAGSALKAHGEYQQEKDRDLKNATADMEAREEVSDPVFSKGQSKRIWGELYKVVDSSDVILQVLDARDPLGTRCFHIEKHIKTEAPHKHLVLILNKCDLVPTWVTVRNPSFSLFFLCFSCCHFTPFGFFMTGSLGQDPVQGVPHPRLSRQHHQPVWKGFPDPAAQAVWQAARGPEADQRGLHRLPQCRQELHHQHPEEEEGVQGRPHPGRDQGLAVRHPHEEDLPD